MFESIDNTDTDTPKYDNIFIEISNLKFEHNQSIQDILNMFESLIEKYNISRPSIEYTTASKIMAEQIHSTFRYEISKLIIKGV
jgi:hypothetical protein